MKRFELIGILILLPFLGYSQGGSWYVGGILGYNTSKSDAGLEPSTSSWSAGPEIGTFFNERWSAGIALGLDGSSSKNKNGDVSKSFMFNPDLYVRRWCKAGDRLSIFTGLDVTFGTGQQTIYGMPDTEVDLSSFGVNANAGLAYALADRWTLLMKFAGIGYTSSKTGDETTNSFNFLADGNITNGQFIFIGLYWTFKPPK